MSWFRTHNASKPETNSLMTGAGKRTRGNLRTRNRRAHRANEGPEERPRRSADEAQRIGAARTRRVAAAKRLAEEQARQIAKAQRVEEEHATSVTRGRRSRSAARSGLRSRESRTLCRDELAPSRYPSVSKGYARPTPQCSRNKRLSLRIPAFVNEPRYVLPPMNITCRDRASDGPVQRGSGRVSKPSGVFSCSHMSRGSRHLDSCRT